MQIVITVDLPESALETRLRFERMSRADFKDKMRAAFMQDLDDAGRICAGAKVNFEIKENSVNNQPTKHHAH